MAKKKKTKEHGIGNFAMLVPKSPRGMKNMGTVMHGGSLYRESKQCQSKLSPEAKTIARELETKARKELEAGQDPMPGFVDQCMGRIGGKVDDPGAYCAAIKDKITGTTHWRGKG